MPRLSNMLPLRIGSGKSVLTVSYTHLDVYKRQVYFLQTVIYHFKRLCNAVVKRFLQFFVHSFTHFIQLFGVILLKRFQPILYSGTDTVQRLFVLCSKDLNCSSTCCRRSDTIFSWLSCFAVSSVTSAVFISEIRLSCSSNCLFCAVVSIRFVSLTAC